MPQYYDDNYDLEEYDDQPSRMPTSARRYVTQKTTNIDLHDRLTEALSRVPRRTTPNPATMDQARRSSRINATTTTQQTQQTRRRTTADDPAIQPAQKQVSRRGAIRNLAMYGISSVIGGGALALKGHDMAEENHEDTVQGKSAASSYKLACGHGDSKEHPTLLHCFVEMEGSVYTRVNFLEYPGGSLEKLRPYQSDDLRKKYDPAELSRVLLQMDVMPVDGGRYQIQLTLTLSQKNIISAPPQPVHILFVDRGHGYFEAVQPTAK
jgi:hypothetical protein